MTRRCHHEFETKDGYPDDLHCQKCDAIYHISEYHYMNAKQLMAVPMEVRRKVLEWQAEQFNKENPDYYLEELEACTPTHKGGE